MKNFIMLFLIGTFFSTSIAHASVLNEFAGKYYGQAGIFNTKECEVKIRDLTTEFYAEIFINGKIKSQMRIDPKFMLKVNKKNNTINQFKYWKMKFDKDNKLEEVNFIKTNAHFVFDNVECKNLIKITE